MYNNLLRNAGVAYYEGKGSLLDKNTVQVRHMWWIDAEGVHGMVVDAAQHCSLLLSWTSSVREGSTVLVSMCRHEAFLLALPLYVELVGSKDGLLVRHMR